MFVCVYGWIDLYISIRGIVAPKHRKIIGVICAYDISNIINRNTVETLLSGPQLYGFTIIRTTDQLY